MDFGWLEGWLKCRACLHRHVSGVRPQRSSEVDQRFAGLEQVLSGWSPGPLDVLRNRMPDVECLGG